MSVSVAGKRLQRIEVMGIHAATAFLYGIAFSCVVNINKDGMIWQRKRILKR